MSLNLNHPLRLRILSDITQNFGRKLVEGDSVLDLGCGGGNISFAIAKKGFFVKGVDRSRKAIDAAIGRNNEYRGRAVFVQADIETFTPEKTFDAVVSFRTFYKYLKNPQDSLKKIYPYINKKIIIDIDPRTEISIGRAVLDLKNAGFKNVRWQPLFVPTVNMPPLIFLKFLRFLEKVPLLARVILTKKFIVILSGEK